MLLQTLQGKTQPSTSALCRVHTSIKVYVKVSPEIEGLLRWSLLNRSIRLCKSCWSTSTQEWKHNPPWRRYYTKCFISFVQVMIYYLLCSFPVHRPAIVVLLMSMVNERQPFVLRCAVLYCFQCFLYKNQKGQGEIVATLLPSTIDGQLHRVVIVSCWYRLRREPCYIYYFVPQLTPSQRASCSAEACSRQTPCPTGVPRWPWPTLCRTTSPRRSNCWGFNWPPAWASPLCLCSSSAPTSSPR